MLLIFVDTLFVGGQLVIRVQRQLDDAAYQGKHSGNRVEDLALVC